MNINLKNAIKHFYPTPCYEQVYFEAVANAIDASASEISILIKVDAFDRPDTLSLTITDNGAGFTDSRFEKFARLLEVDNAEHKGLGRLVYLAYFNEVQVVSQYDGKKRTFIFNSEFAGASTITDSNASTSGTTLTYREFGGTRVKSYQYLKPVEIKQQLLAHFIPVLFKQKQAKKDLRIDIELQTTTPNPARDFFSDRQTLSLSDLPEFKKASCSDNALDFFQQIEIHYRIEHDQTRPKSLMTAICSDGRTIEHDLVPMDAIPEGYQIMFLFVSDYFCGKTDKTRQKLELPDTVSERTLKQRLRKEINRIILEEIPVVRQLNEATTGVLTSRYPHLQGYFPTDTVGLIVRQEAIDGAQQAFLADQKAILECAELDEEQYEKALEVSARVLMEYILHRTKIIDKLKDMDIAKNESDIHDIIVPRRRTLRKDAFDEDIFNNNVWMLDDKYMSYSTILSDEDMSKVVKEIALEEESVSGRPDITLVFSGDPQTATKVDVVVVELKKHGVPLAKKEEVVSQLKQRARRLIKHYPAKIERIWFYGITDIDSEFRRSLKEDGYKELFSHGSMFYKPQPILVDDDSEEFLIDLYVMTYETFIKDAESRNATFLKVLKEGIRKATGEHKQKVESAPEVQV